MHYQNDTFLFLLQEVSLKYHKSNMKCKRLRVYTLHNSKKAVTAD